MAEKRILPDWVDKSTIPDLYRRGVGGSGSSQVETPIDELPTLDELDAMAAASGYDYNKWFTNPGSRPVVYQRGFDIQVLAGVAAAPLVNVRLDCDGFLLDVYSTAANSVFWGLGSSVTVTSGTEIRPGLPQTFFADNTREQWELQRLLEAMAAMQAGQLGISPLPQFRSPRVVINAADVFLIAAAPTSVAVKIFLVPEMQ